MDGRGAVHRLRRCEPPAGHQRGRSGGGAPHLRGDADHRVANADRGQLDCRGHHHQGLDNAGGPDSQRHAHRQKYLHKPLRNRISLGELSHKGNWYPGAHPPIIDRELWDKVHAVLARDGHTRSVETKIRSCTDALLRGLLYAPSGERMYPTYSRKKGRKYHYYVSKSESRFGAPGKSYERLPAPEIEAAVVAQIRTVLTRPESIASVARHIQRNGAQIDEATTVMAMGRLNDVWNQLFPVERHRIANLTIERIDLVHVGEMQGIKVKWRELGWDKLIGEFAPREIGAELMEVDAW